MKKSIILFFSLFLTIITTSYSQFYLSPTREIGTKTFSYPKINGIEVNAPVKIMLRQSPKVTSTQISVEGANNLVSFVDIKAVKSGTIKIDWKSKGILKQKDYPLITITTPTITNISLSAASILIASSPISLPLLNISLKENSYMKIPLFNTPTLNATVSFASNLKIIDIHKDIKNITLKVSNASDVEIRGKSKIHNATITVTNTSDLKMKNVVVENMTLVASQNSNANIKVYKSLTLTAKDNSTVTLYQRPKKLNKTTVLDTSKFYIKQN